MAITREVNVNLLNECFELTPFHGLHKPHQDDVIVLANDDDDEEQADDIQTPPERREDRRKIINNNKIYNLKNFH